MGDVTGVRAKPGGAVTLRFTENGFRAVPRPQGAGGRFLDVVLGDVFCAVSLVVAAFAGSFASYRWGEGEVEVALVFGVLAAPFALVVLTRVVVEVVGHAAFLLMVVGMMLLLLVPWTRRRAKAWWRKKPPASLLDRHIFVEEVEPASVTRDGSTVTVVLEVAGQRVRYRAGDALEREFRALLSAPRPTTGVGP